MRDCATESAQLNHVRVFVRLLPAYYRSFGPPLFLAHT